MQRKRQRHHALEPHIAAMCCWSSLLSPPLLRQRRKPAVCLVRTWSPGPSRMSKKWTSHLATFHVRAPLAILKLGADCRTHPIIVTSNLPLNHTLVATSDPHSFRGTSGPGTMAFTDGMLPLHLKKTEPSRRSEQPLPHRHLFPTLYYAHDISRPCSALALRTSWPKQSNHFFCVERSVFAVFFGRFLQWSNEHLATVGADRRKMVELFSKKNTHLVMCASGRADWPARR